ncbi:hypothetical protein SLEP1_g43629 [Rubroshorea leprosula]|uniref:Uncharacterized protein n=1 Tax=Rubroshorea leprosula TaxID=152421 RepID=A0AAV5LDK6_9ROSI|nr:hypothetical protein SLEP1_g43629 [Rubroshorea leprosula]
MQTGSIVTWALQGGCSRKRITFVTTFPGKTMEQWTVVAILLACSLSLLIRSNGYLSVLEELKQGKAKSAPALK